VFVCGGVGVVGFCLLLWGGGGVGGGREGGGGGKDGVFAAQLGDGKLRTSSIADN